MRNVGSSHPDPFSATAADTATAAPAASPRRRRPGRPAPRLPPGAKHRAKLTYERLRDAYPAVTELAHHDPFQLLIATILSAQTTDKMVNLVTPELFRRYPTPADLAAADEVGEDVPSAAGDAAGSGAAW